MGVGLYVCEEALSGLFRDRLALMALQLLPVSPDVATIKGDVILWAGALLGVFLVWYAGLRMLDILEEQPENEDDED